MTSVLHLLTSPAAVAVRALPLLADAAIKGLVIFGAAAILGERAVARVAAVGIRFRTRRGLRRRRRSRSSA